MKYENLKKLRLILAVVELFCFSLTNLTFFKIKKSEVVKNDRTDSKIKFQASTLKNVDLAKRKPKKHFFGTFLFVQVFLTVILKSPAIACTMIFVKRS